jgi:hypothetical protein
VRRVGDGTNKRLSNQTRDWPSKPDQRCERFGEA